MKKMTIWEKALSIIGIAVVIFAIVLKGLLGVNDIGTLVILAFMGILLYVIFLVCSFFPADWRMTEKQKAKIINKDAYQEKYRKIMVGITFTLSIFSAIIIMICA